MRILWLDCPARWNRYDDWLHWKFAKKISKHADIFFYAPCMFELEPMFTPLEYKKDRLLKNVVRELKIDAVILDTKSAAFNNYFPKSMYPERNNEGDCRLPPDFADCDVLKICLEEDFQYETNTKWYEDMGFEVILQRHYSQFLRNMYLTQEFFPFSVDTEVFKPTMEKRCGKIGFVGTTQAKNGINNEKVSVYHPREKALYYLEASNILAPVVAGLGHNIYGQDYVNYLHKYIGYVSCGSKYDLTPAKMTEIMASGGVLLTNEVSGLDKLFNEGSYLVYKDEDIIEQAERIINDYEYTNKINDKANACILSKHTHDIRTQELLALIEKYR